MKLSSRTQGFTLIELSIVLVIIGLLVGGILVGRDLVRASELRKVMSEVDALKIAVNNFRGKYSSLPGDMPNAAQFWGPADAGDGVGADCGLAESTDATTCSGNGNWRIDALVGVQEKLRLPQHLVNAGLITGNYRGAFTSGVAYIGTHFIPASYGRGGYELAYINSTMYTNSASNAIKIATRSASDTTGMNGSLLSPLDAFNIDSKIDDGSSNSGKVNAIDGADFSGCVTNGVTFSAGTVGSYILTTTTGACRVYVFGGL